MKYEQYSLQPPGSNLAWIVYNTLASLANRTIVANIFVYENSANERWPATVPLLYQSIGYKSVSTTTPAVPPAITTFAKSI